MKTYFSTCPLMPTDACANIRKKRVWTSLISRLPSRNCSPCLFGDCADTGGSLKPLNFAEISKETSEIPSPLSLSVREREARLLRASEKVLRRKSLYDWCGGDLLIGLSLSFRLEDHEHAPPITNVWVMIQRPPIRLSKRLRKH